MVRSRILQGELHWIVGLTSRRGASFQIGSKGTFDSILWIYVRSL